MSYCCVVMLFQIKFWESKFTVHDYICFAHFSIGHLLKALVLTNSGSHSIFNFPDQCTCTKNTPKQFKTSRYALSDA